MDWVRILWVTHVENFYTIREYFSGTERKGNIHVFSIIMIFIQPWNGFTSQTFLSCELYTPKWILLIPTLHFTETTNLSLQWHAGHQINPLFLSWCVLLFHFVGCGLRATAPTTIWQTLFLLQVRRRSRVWIEDMFVNSPFHFYDDRIPLTLLWSKWPFTLNISTTKLSLIN